MTRRFFGVVVALLLALLALLQRRWVVVVFVLLLVVWLTQHISCQHNKRSPVFDPACPILPCTGSDK